MPHRRLWRSLLLLLFGLTALPTGNAVGQAFEDVVRYSERLPAAGGATAGMAGAGLLSGVDDTNALFGNPAGLGWLSTSTIGADFAVQRAQSTTQFETPAVTTSGERSVSDYQLGSLAGAYSFPTEQGSLVLGLSLHQANTYEQGFDTGGRNRSTSITEAFVSPYRLDGDEIVFDDSRAALAYDAGAIDFSGTSTIGPAVDFDTSAVAGDMVIDQQENVLESGQMNELAIGGAVEVAPGVMLGASLNRQFGTYTFERFYRETDESGLRPPVDPTDPETPYDPYFVGGTELEGFREVQFEERIDTEINGVSLRFGLSAQVTSGLRGGMRIESPTWYNLTEVFGTEIRTDFDCDFALSGRPCPEGGAAGFESGSLTGNEFEYRIRTPWRLGAGFQYTVAGLTVAGDVEVIDWTQAQVSADDEDFSDLNREIQGIDDTVNSRFGVEYTFGNAAVRAGAAYRQNPGDASFRDVDGQTTEGDRLFLSGGASYMPSDEFALHVNWLQERFDDAFASYSDGPTTREEVSRSQFQIGFTYRP